MLIGHMSQYTLSTGGRYYRKSAYAQIYKWFDFFGEVLYFSVNVVHFFDRGLREFDHSDEMNFSGINDVWLSWLMYRPKAVLRTNLLIVSSLRI